jgi:hypothetical protein
VSFDIVSVSSPIPTQAIPTDITPDLDVDEPDVTDSEAPYGYTPTGRVRKRPTGSRKNATRQAGASNEKLARQAAKTLVQTSRHHRYSPHSHRSHGDRGRVDG